MSSTSSSHPRRIDWTGERCVPWSDDLQVIYEHYQRYLFIAPLATGRRVLDLASGEGYGTAILAAEAQSVLGLDIDEDSVLHATETYQSPNITFQKGDMLDLAPIEDDTFDLIVCFEALEHVEDHQRLLDGVARVLAPGGTFVVSTPDRLTYTEDLGQVNPFHVHELSRDEFEHLLAGRFANVQMWGQNVSVGSLMVPLDSGDGSGQVVVLTHEDDQWRPGAKLNPTYLVAVASDAPLADLPSYSTLIDPDIEIVRNAMRQRDEARNISNTLSERLAQNKAENDRRRNDEHLLRRRVEAAEGDLTRVSDWLARTEEHAKHLEIHRAFYQAELERLQASRAYRIGGSLGGVVERLLPPGSGRRAMSARLKRQAQLLLGHPASQDPVVTPEESPTTPPSALGTSTEPRVSVVIPVHNGWELTVKCLWSLAREKSETPYEIIIVDDASSDDTSTQLNKVRGIKVLRLENNLGFLEAVNTGAATAKGDYIVLLNNDVEVQAGWLDSFVKTAETDSSIGIIGARLVYPDGQLQEAGGVIWNDASGWNYGRHQDADDPSFNFRRDVDYCSGACLLVRRDLWEKVGGFDTTFAPAYYEDADLAFSARELGFRVVYEPNSHVIHNEGSSYGTDASPKKTKLMERNRRAFQEKWSVDLRNQCPPNANLMRTASWRRPAGHALVVDHMIPTFDQDAGSLRMFEIVRMLTELDFAVTFIPLNGAYMPKYHKAIQELGVEVLHGTIDYAKLIAEWAPDLRVAILSRPNVAWGILPILREFAPDTKIIYDTVDLHFVRERRRAEIDNTLEASRNAERYYDMELWLTRVSDAVIVVSDTERDVLAAEAPDTSIYVIPTIHQGHNAGVSYHERQGLLFVGSFNHPPNRDAVQWLTSEVLPIVRRSLPELSTYIVGSNPTEEITDLAGDGVEVLGWVPNLDSLYSESRLFVAPLRYGAGIRGKIGESASYGLPVVSTSLGAEGLNLRPGLEILVADGAEAFAAAIVRGYNDSALWQTLADGSRQAIAAQCSPSVVRDELSRALEDLRVGK